MEDILSEWALMDIVPKKGKFTWTNRRVGGEHIAVRLDRFLIHKIGWSDV